MIYCYTECFYAERQYAECHYTEFRSSECRMAIYIFKSYGNLINVILPNGILPNVIRPNVILPNVILPNVILPNIILPNIILKKCNSDLHHFAESRAPFRLIQTQYICSLELYGWRNNKANHRHII